MAFAFTVAGFAIMGMIWLERRKDILHGNYIDRVEGEMSELEPTPEFLDDTPIREVQFPTRIKNTLFAAGLKTVGEVREISDEALLSLPDFGRPSVAQLREMLGLPSTDRVRPAAGPKAKR